MHIRDLTNINEAEGKTASFAFGRMNPPTIGHKKLADTVIAQAGDPYIFLSQSQKPQTDPLDFTTKVALARQFFPGISVGDPSVKTIIEALTKLDSLGYDNIIYVAGSDRIQDFTELLNKYNGTPDKSGNIAYTFKDIKVVSAGERDPDAEGAEGMSASKMRAAAAKGDFEAFKSGTPEPKLAQTMYDRVRAGMGITETTYSQRMTKVIETLQDLHRAKPLDETTTQYVLKQVSIIKEHLSLQEKDKDLSEVYSPEIDDKWMEREIRATAKKHGIDPNVAVRVWRSEGGSSKNYQSKIKRSGKGSVGGQEASYGPYQLYTGGGLGNEYQEKYGVDLSADNSPQGLQRQIDFALGKAKRVGWKPWYGAAKVGIGDRDGIHGKRYADAGNIATDASVDDSDPSDRGGTDVAKPEKRAKVKATAANTRDYDKTIALQKELINRGANIEVDGLMGPNTRAAMKKFGNNPVSVDEATLDLPDLESGDELMVGKFKNRKATIKDFKKDDHGQPVAVTNKGDQKIFKGRVKKLMPTEDALNEKCWDGYKQVGMKKKGKRKVPNCVPESDTTEGKSPHKKGTKKYNKHMAAMHAGMNEAKKSGSYLLQLERDDDIMVLTIKSTKTGQRTEVRGKPGYELDGYDATDPLHQMLDKVGKAASISDLMNGDVVSINPNHPDGPRAREELNQITDEGVGRIVKGVNTTPDVGVNQTKIEAAKLNIKVDKDGRPPVLERGSIGVPLSSGLTVNVAPHRELKIKKSTKGRLNYENPRTNRQPKSKRGATV